MALSSRKGHFKAAKGYFLVHKRHVSPVVVTKGHFLGKESYFIQKKGILKRRKEHYKAEKEHFLVLKKGI